jgi:hypothetical protein
MGRRIRALRQKFGDVEAVRTLHLKWTTAGNRLLNLNRMAIEAWNKARAQGRVQGEVPLESSDPSLSGWWGGVPTIIGGAVTIVAGIIIGATLGPWIVLVGALTLAIGGLVELLSAVETSGPGVAIAAATAVSIPLVLILAIGLGVWMLTKGKGRRALS